jgi:hypothetical protein
MKPLKQQLTFMFIILSGFIFPIFISCIFYTKLIIYKKKTFHNKVDVLNVNDKKEFYNESSSEPKNPNFISLHQSDAKKLDLPQPKIQEAAVDHDKIEVVHDIPAIFSAEEEKMFENKETERNKAQIAAAERSMKTNLLVGAGFCLFLFIQMAFVPKSMREYVGLMVCSTLRCVLPIFTTIANFGTVQFVLSLYCNAFLKILPFSTKLT